MTVVKVRLFAALRELAGSNEVEAEAASVGDLVETLSRRFGERFGKVARTGSVVVDGERAGPETPLTGGTQEVAVLPPVSGG
jgi:sulfur-carrier protein